ncbi:MAG: peptidase M23 [Parcubacteria group bacterium Gr01-1014_56]|nr:MAG: peptidase M23 [Parcubacteria group bacterium Gr01-1014_56]
MRHVRYTVAAFFFALFLALGATTYIHADTQEEIQAQINESNKQIEALKAEIAELQGELNDTTKQKQTLQGAIKELNLNIQKLKKSITLTQTQIKQKDLEIGTLSTTISDTSGKIGASQSQIADSLRQLEAHDEQPMIVTLFSGGTLSSFFDEATTLESMRTLLQDHIHTLQGLKVDLESDKDVAEKKRRELAKLNTSLGQQNQGLTISRNEQTKLLDQTKNKESTYQAQIAQKKALEAKFEQDLLNYEAQLNLIVNPGSFAAPKAGVLLWPVEQPHVTQYFGNTAFATQNAQIYGGKGHNAIDLRAPPGTPILAARGGVVRGVGNTDLVCPGASYGKWVFIDHDNGLSTLYAHLSTFTVSEGAPVASGQVIGYSDTTGYATGPHLHFGVYASSGAEIRTFPSKSCVGKVYTMPVADVSAYLNPLSYLPPL